MRAITIATLLAFCMGVPAVCGAAPVDAAAQVRELKITILSTMVADYGTRGEWGFSALVEADGRKLLVDTGGSPGTVLDNAKALGIDLSDVEEVVLTHNHDDHTAGFLSLREALMRKNPRAMSRVHLASATFMGRLQRNGSEANYMVLHRAEMEKLGVSFVMHDQPTQLLPGVWFSGPVPRKFPERNWAVAGPMVLNGKMVEDTIPEDSSLVINTAQGTVLLSGCGHAGVVNTMTYVQELLPGRPITALVGGFHLFPLDDARLDWTGQQMQAFGVKWLLGAHCTGFEAVYRLRRQLQLPREAAIVAAVGSRYSLKDGVTPDASGLTR